ncbi:hypothetical protein [Tersicoccus sp. Bi-70]|uniref:hypothetical protein n=1 Tax=Tersicoccus sp. Bi-70 TaxID=1897634 RepID=UPI000977E3C5|nr:hypothetical protein [Tersicoccus sp. Bi-70]OMH31305.1 hypothetical protein BGP79_09775 [Tersicoccus sp. Bi-70]
MIDGQNRLLTGAYGTHEGRRHQLIKATPSQGEYFVAAGEQGRGESVTVNESEVTDVFSVRVTSSWRDCEVLVHEDLGEGRWEVEFVDGARAWAAGAQRLPGIDGDPHDRVTGWMSTDDLAPFTSHVQRYAGRSFSGDPEERWESGPLA